MRVCIFTHTFPRFRKDIAAPFMSGVASSIARAGAQVFVLTPFSPSFQRTKANYKLITYKYIYPDFLHKLGYSQTLADDKHLRPLALILAPFMFIFGAIALFKLVKREKIDIINAHWILPNGFIACMISKLTGIPVVSTLPGSDVYMASRNIVFRKMAEFAARNSALITSNSPKLMEDLKRLAGLKDNKFHPIIYGVDPAQFYPAKETREALRKKLGIDKKSKVVVGVGRLVAKKGFKYLIKAAPAIIREVPNTIFVIVGDGDERNVLEELSRRLGIGDKFRFTGSVNYKDLIYYYNLGDVFVLPSVRDEMGNLDDQSVSVVEAMACGLPVITTDFPGYRLVIRNQVNGFLVKEKSTSLLSRIVTKLLKSVRLRKKIGKKALDSVLTDYSWDSIGYKYLECFEKVLSQKKDYSFHIKKILDSNERKRIASQILKVLKIHLKSDTRKMKLLDVGCSSGEITKYLAPYFFSLVGIDVDGEALNVAENKKSSNVKFKKMAAEKMSFADESFDVVLANQIYQFVDDDKKVFSEIMRVLKPGGVCFVGAFNKYNLIEPQYGLPLLSFLPKRFSDLAVRLLGRDSEFVGRYKSYWQLKKLMGSFKIFDYTLEILRNPLKYGYKRLRKYEMMARLLPLKILEPFAPNFIWILEKPLEN